MSWGKTRELGEPLGNTLGTKEKNLPLPPTPTKRKTLDLSKMHVEPFHWLHESFVCLSLGLA